YGDVTNPRTHEYIFPGLEPGSELAWNAMAGPQANALAVDEFKYVVFKNPEWDYHRLNFDSDIEKADEEDKGLLNSTDPNLKTFVEKGGKLLVYHGWDDQLISPRNSVDYLKSVQKMVGPKVSDSFRLFMVPGMTHCRGGDGATTFDMLHV